MTRRLTKPLLVLLLAPGIVGLLVVLGIALFGWNWARAPIQQGTLAQTGRALVIAGDLKLHLDWPFVRVESEQVFLCQSAMGGPAEDAGCGCGRIFGGPAGVVEPRHCLAGCAPEAPHRHAEIARWPQVLVAGQLQRDETAQVAIARLTLDHGQLELDDSQHDTHIHLSVDTKDTSTGSVAFKADGKFQGLPLVATGTSASVLALRDEQVPFPLTVDAKVGPTALQAHGTLTGLFALTGLDMQLRCAAAAWRSCSHCWAWGCQKRTPMP
ncbi:MAG: hypothetical protein IPF38_12800 [Burkholderiales bacterium]|nr:hypothetical protein [Burkholderiales bacterium]